MVFFLYSFLHCKLPTVQEQLWCPSIAKLFHSTTTYSIVAVHGFPPLISYHIVQVPTIWQQLWSPSFLQLLQCTTAYSILAVMVFLPYSDTLLYNYLQYSSSHGVPPLLSYHIAYLSTVQYQSLCPSFTKLSHCTSAYSIVAVIVSLLYSVITLYNCLKYSSRSWYPFFTQLRHCTIS